MEWLDLVAPSAAILALFIAIGLIVQSVRHGRAIKRIEERLAQSGSTSVEASLERVKQLQARAAISSGTGVPPGAVRTGLIATAVILVVALAGVVGWLFLLRGDGDPDATASPQTQIAGRSAPAQPTIPADPGTVPVDPPPIENPARFEIAVFNGSGVAGAAGENVGPFLRGEGWQVPDGLVVNEPNGRIDFPTTLVQFNRNRRAAGAAVAEDLGIRDFSPLDGYTDEQIGGADVLVVVGQDLASNPP